MSQYLLQCVTPTQRKIIEQYLTPAQEKEKLLRMLLTTTTERDALRSQNEQLLEENRKMKLEIEKLKTLAIQKETDDDTRDFEIPNILIDFNTIAESARRAFLVPNSAKVTINNNTMMSSRPEWNWNNDS